MSNDADPAASRGAAAVRRLDVVQRRGAGLHPPTGLLLALAILAVAALGARSGLAAPGARQSFVDLGLLLSVLFGFLSAIWWHQSADIADAATAEDRALQWAANRLSAAAATTTALSLVSGVFTSLPWRSDATWLSGLVLLTIIVMSGDDLRCATRISLNFGLRLRAVLGLSMVGLLLLVFIWTKLRG
ncbi:hypothetical protein [Acidisoma sp.]|uniref:hypothetical protein n=1 Tax=Acidisoma sp. TaxID=1872115 RepID=UPI003B0046E1